MTTAASELKLHLPSQNQNYVVTNSNKNIYCNLQFRTVIAAAIGQVIVVGWPTK